MKKIMSIEGMSCSHCSGRVEKALNEIPGVTAIVNLEEKNATITMESEVSNETLNQAVTEVGYEVVSIK